MNLELNFFYLKFYEFGIEFFLIYVEKLM